MTGLRLLEWMLDSTFYQYLSLFLKYSQQLLSASRKEGEGFRGLEQRSSFLSFPGQTDATVGASNIVAPTVVCLVTVVRASFTGHKLQSNIAQHHPTMLHCCAKMLHSVHQGPYNEPGKMVDECPRDHFMSVACTSNVSHPFIHFWSFEVSS